MKEQLLKIKESAISELYLCNDKVVLENLRVKYLGKKGELTAILKQMGGLSAEERPIIGQLANSVRTEIEKAIETESDEIKVKELENSLKSEFIDVTLPGKT